LKEITDPEMRGLLASIQIGNAAKLLHANVEYVLCTDSHGENSRKVILEYKDEIFNTST
jgi:hypothetical protein